MAFTKARTVAGKRRFVSKVMHKFKVGSLKSGSGGKIRSRKQAIAVALKLGKLSRRRK